MDLEMLGELVDPLGEERDLDLRRPRVGVVELVLGDRGAFVGHAEGSLGQARSARPVSHRTRKPMVAGSSRDAPRASRSEAEARPGARRPPPAGEAACGGSSGRRMRTWSHV